MVGECGLEVGWLSWPKSVQANARHDPKTFTEIRGFAQPSCTHASYVVFLGGFGCEIGPSAVLAKGRLGAGSMVMRPRRGASANKLADGNPGLAIAHVRDVLCFTYFAHVNADVLSKHSGGYSVIPNASLFGLSGTQCVQ